MRNSSVPSSLYVTMCTEEATSEGRTKGDEFLSYFLHISVFRELEIAVVSSKFRERYGNMYSARCTVVARINSSSLLSRFPFFGSGKTDKNGPIRNTPKPTPCRPQPFRCTCLPASATRVQQVMPSTNSCRERPSFLFIFHPFGLNIGPNSHYHRIQSQSQTNQSKSKR